MARSSNDKERELFVAPIIVGKILSGDVKDSRAMDKKQIITQILFMINFILPKNNLVQKNIKI